MSLIFRWWWVPAIIPETPGSEHDSALDDSLNPPYLREGIPLRS